MDTASGAWSASTSRSGVTLRCNPRTHFDTHAASERASERETRTQPAALYPSSCTGAQHKHSIVVIFSGGTPQANVVLISWRARGILSGFYLCVRYSHISCAAVRLYFFPKQKQNWCEKSGRRLRACSFRVIKPWNDLPPESPSETQTSPLRKIASLSVALGPW